MFIHEIASIPQDVSAQGMSGSTETKQQVITQDVSASDVVSVKKSQEQALKRVFAHIYSGIIKDSMTSDALSEGSSQLSLQDESIYDQYADIIAEKMISKMNLINLMATRSFE